MNVEHYKAETLRALFLRRKVLNMPALKKALGTNVDMTVFRKLRQLSYRTSFSHGARYYTLDEIARFDEHGLWRHKGISFSRHGTLLATLEAMVHEASAGLFASDLQERLQVGVRESLLRLAKKDAVHREKIGHRYLYCSTKPAARRKQLKLQDSAMTTERRPSQSEGPSGDEVKAAVVLFLSLLDEKQRRLYAGLESLKLGSGNDHHIASILGVHPQTVTKGRQELLERDVELERVRRAGGGREPVEKKRRRSSKPSKR